MKSRRSLPLRRNLTDQWNQSIRSSDWIWHCQTYKQTQGFNAIPRQLTDLHGDPTIPEHF